MATQAPPALRPDLAAVFGCLTGRCGDPATRSAPKAGILAELAAHGRPQ